MRKPYVPEVNVVAAAVPAAADGRIVVVWVAALVICVHCAVVSCVPGGGCTVCHVVVVVTVTVAVVTDAAAGVVGVATATALPMDCSVWAATGGKRTCAACAAVQFAWGMFVM